MQLVDAIFEIAELSDDSVIFAKEPFAWGSEAVISKLSDDHRVPPQIEAGGFSYFLGKEEVSQGLELLSKKSSSRNTKAEFLCHYAVLDAYPSWFHDLPDV